jgi:hypothetical protein
LAAGVCLPAARLSPEPLTPLAASVSARLGRRRPAARESGQTVRRPEASFIGGDPLLADLRRRASDSIFALRRLTAPFHPRSAFRAFRRLRLPRARSAATPSGPPSLVRSPDCASSDPTAAFRLLQLTRPVGAPCCERSTLARAGCRALAEHPHRLPRYPSSCEAGASRASRFLDGPLGAAASHMTPCEACGPGGPRRRIRADCVEPLLVSPPEHPIVTDAPPRRPGVPAPRVRRPEALVPATPREGRRFPESRVLFTVRSMSPSRGFPPLRGDGWSLLSRCFPRGVSMARGGPAPCCARPTRAQL